MPHHISPDIVRSRLQACRQVGKSYFDRRTKPLEPLEIGNPEQIQHMQNKTWQQAVITDIHNDRSYSLRTADGATHSRHLIKINECMPPETPDVEMHIPEETSPLEPQQSETPQPSIS